MKIIEASTIAELVRKGIPHLAYELPVDISAGQCAMCEHERIPIGKSVLSQLCTNDKIAREDQVPLCQDTGTVRVSIQVGKDVAVYGDDCNESAKEVKARMQELMQTVKTIDKYAQ